MPAAPILQISQGWITSYLVIGDGHFAFNAFFLDFQIIAGFVVIRLDQGIDLATLIDMVQDLSYGSYELSLINLSILF